MRPAQIVSRLSSLIRLFYGVMLIGCSAVAISPSEPMPQQSPDSSSAPDTPLDAPSTKETDFVALEEANSIYFAKGATRIDTAGQDKLRHHAVRLKANPAQVVTLAGYTDDLGSASYNLAIAERRIEAVAKLLRTYGVPKNQIHPLRRYSAGRGEAMPACRTTECRQIMRRVEVIYGIR
ncbi:MAG: Minor outer membrane protein Omp16 [Candidatus Accumulibacter vicinus]|uniref:Minor outer membrane protein Omp16 n=1 Tax=Candidatus Accumulibacter vicinus TaxID=2954382 RepID=A0A084XVL6_9PROT|nr:MAG: Minor outer membrane protein Omp16 [Candidatus Accumulibacter vicinus]